MRRTARSSSASHSRSSPDPFDAVVASRSLHHVPDLALAVDKIAQLAPLLIVEEFAWDQLDERTAAWYVSQLDGPSKSVQQCLHDWREEHAGLHGYEALLAAFDRRFGQRLFAWRPYLHRYARVRADQKSEQSLIDAGDINALGFDYVGARNGRQCRIAPSRSRSARASAAALVTAQPIT